MTEIMENYKFSPEVITAAAKAMFEERPRDTDPTHWELSWEDVPDDWKRGQERAAERVLRAGYPLMVEDIAKAAHIATLITLGLTFSDFSED